MYLRRFGWEDRNAQFAALLGYLAHRRAGQDREAARVLEDAATHSKPGVWPEPIVRYFRREIEGTMLLALATDKGKMTEAQTYVALDLLLSGRFEEALPHLGWVRDKGDRDFIEHELAMGELRRLGAR